MSDLAITILAWVLTLTLVGSFFVPRLRIPTGVIWTVMAAVVAWFTAAAAIEGRDIDYGLPLTALALFTTVGLAELLWGHQTGDQPVRYTAMPGSRRP